MSELAVSVIVAARDAEATLPATLTALAAQEEVPGGSEVIVVDNGSLDGTAAVAERAGVSVIRRERGAGPGAARNAGAAAAQGRVLAFTDADCEPQPAWLRAGLAELDGGLDLVQGRVEAQPGVTNGPFDRTLWVTRAWGLFETANLFVTREAFDRAGGFDAGPAPNDGAPFGEDVVFGWTVVRNGGRSGFSDAALVYHAVFPRGPAGYLAERRRAGLFPGLVARVPELRARFLTAGVFLSPRSAAFDAAVAGLAMAAVSRRRLPIIALAPWLGLVRTDARRFGLRRALVIATADAVGFASLVRGTVRDRTLVL